MLRVSGPCQVAYGQSSTAVRPGMRGSCVKKGVGGMLDLPVLGNKVARTQGQDCKVATVVWCLRIG